MAKTNSAVSPDFRAAGLCVVIALAVRFAYLVFARQTPFYAPSLLDPAYYHDWALRLSRGIPDQSVFYGLPLYPYFLALCYKLHASIDAVKVLQALLGGVTAYFIYLIGFTLAGKRTALFSGLFAAVYGPLFFHELIFIPESLGTALYAAALYLALRLDDRPTAKRAAVFGVTAGLAALTKAGIILFVPLFLMGIWFRRWGQSPGTVPGTVPRSVLICLGAFLLTLAPVPAHNLIVGKDFVLLTSHSGFNFYIGNNEKAEGVFTAPEGTGSNVEAQIRDSRSLAEKEVGRLLKPSEVSRYWSAKAWTFIRENPGRFLWLCGRKILLFFDAREISDVEGYAFSKELNPFLRVPWPNFVLLGPLFAIGLAASFNRLRHRGIVWLWIGSYVVGLMGFFVNARYRLPLMSALIPLAAFGVGQFADAAKGRKWTKVSLYAAAAITAVVIGHLRLVTPDVSGDYVNAGDALLRQKNAASAIVFYEKAMAADPASAKAMHAMGIALTTLRRYDDALPYYLKALEKGREDSQIYNNLGLYYDRIGDLDRAESFFLKAIELKPDSPQAHNNLGMVYGKRGDTERAKKEFERSIELNAANPRALTNLGLLMYELGRPQEAKALWEKALVIDPYFEEAKKAVTLLARRSQGLF